MIVLGPRDADLGGAPDHWREGNWRPDTLDRGPQTRVFTSIPFDKCDVVLEYDARRPERPTPEDQGWRLEGDNGIWSHDPLGGVLRFRSDSNQSFWSQQGDTEQPFDRGAAYGLFQIARPAREPSEPGLDFLFHASPEDGRLRGMRGCFSSLWHWRALEGGGIRLVVRAAAEPEILQVWHDFGMDAELMGARINQDNFDRDDGGTTIGNIGAILSNEDRRFFGYPQRDDPRPFAAFGLVDSFNGMSGAVRNYIASFPGRFLRPAFRATALSETTLLRFVFVAGASRSDEPAIFRVHYTSPSLGMRDVALPDREAALNGVRFDPGTPGALAEMTVPLEGLRTGEPIWFTIERDWANRDDLLRDTVHLLSIIMEPTDR